MFEAVINRLMYDWRPTLMPDAKLTRPLQSSKSTFSQPFKEKHIGEVVRIGSAIIFHLSKRWKAKFFILCDVISLQEAQETWSIRFMYQLIILTATKQGK